MWPSAWAKESLDPAQTQKSWPSLAQAKKSLFSSPYIAESAQYRLVFSVKTFGYIGAPPVLRDFKLLGYSRILLCLSYNITENEIFLEIYRV
jgi:hypothetical protein